MALAVDWIMENGDELAAWMGDHTPEPVAGGGAASAAPPAESGDERATPIHLGTRVFTTDGKQGEVVRIHDEGTYDLHMDLPNMSPRQRVSRADFTVDEYALSHFEEEQESLMRHTASGSSRLEEGIPGRADARAGDDDSGVMSASLSPPPDRPSSLPPPMDIQYGDNVEEDMQEDEQGDGTQFTCLTSTKVQILTREVQAGEADNDLARLLSRLREFSGTQFTCFTGTKVQILTQPPRILRAGFYGLASSERCAADTARRCGDEWRRRRRRGRGLGGAHVFAWRSRSACGRRCWDLR